MDVAAHEPVMPDLPRVSPPLRSTVAQALDVLSRTQQPWSRRLEAVLRTRWVMSVRLPGRMRGLTWPLLPVILIDRAVAKAALAAPCGSRVQLELVQTLLHEAAHQLWAVWPEWKLWLGIRGVYGPDRNAADAVSEAVMREGAPWSRYADQQITYCSPLERLVRRRQG
jgi:hypothetical protein